MYLTVFYYLLVYYLLLLFVRLSLSEEENTVIGQ